LATAGGAACLGREDIGSIQAGKAGDLALFDLSDVGFSGSWDPAGALLFCQPTRVRTLIVNGRIVVEEGRILTIDLERVQQNHRRIARSLMDA
jgi:cytosine/adenosine deaminase-related metal-dependent hydrolase